MKYVKAVADERTIGLALPFCSLMKYMDDLLIDSGSKSYSLLHYPWVLFRE